LLIYIALRDFCLNARVVIRVPQGFRLLGLILGLRMSMSSLAIVTLVAVAREQMRRVRVSSCANCMTSYVYNKYLCGSCCAMLARRCWRQRVTHIISPTVPATQANAKEDPIALCPYLLMLVDATICLLKFRSLCFPWREQFTSLDLQARFECSLTSFLEATAFVNAYSKGHQWDDMSVDDKADFIVGNSRETWERHPQA
jgi:hypothetical protein